MEKHFTKRHCLVSCRTRKSLCLLRDLIQSPAQKAQVLVEKASGKARKGMLTNPTYRGLSLLQSCGILNCLCVYIYYVIFFRFFSFIGYYKGSLIYLASLAAYGSSPARDQIGAAAGACATVTAIPKPSHICDLCSLQQC